MKETLFFKGLRSLLVISRNVAILYFYPRRQFSPVSLFCFVFGDTTTCNPLHEKATNTHLLTNQNTDTGLYSSHLRSQCK